MGYEVELAANGKEALEKISEQRPALVLLDLEMPVMDGLETCSAIKRDPDTETISVIMFAGLEPELCDEPTGKEPFDLASGTTESVRSAVQWKPLAYIDGSRDLGTLTHLVGLSPRKMAAALKELAEKGFIKVSKSRPKSDEARAAPQTAADGQVEAFQPRIRAVGLD